MVHKIVDRNKPLTDKYKGRLSDSLEAFRLARRKSFSVIWNLFFAIDYVVDRC